MVRGAKSAPGTLFQRKLSSRTGRRHSVNAFLFMRTVMAEVAAKRKRRTTRIGVCGPPRSNGYPPSLTDWRQRKPASRSIHCFHRLNCHALARSRRVNPIVCSSAANGNGRQITIYVLLGATGKPGSDTGQQFRFRAGLRVCCRQHMDV